ncbi:hypothetical protein JCM19239_2238 [Vibrio variabilis]|uniref:Anthranilate phosphoribosyltransferase n=1 Tax=Vibrio variabilis TaxID=990271 RepID=A0ABQ0JPD9_9VIBR|nr:hypothetical protein JCM19239_2238 [Vibrio variabilis]
MNPIIALLKENNIGDAQINEIFETLTQNPLAAMATISSLVCLKTNCSFLWVKLCKTLT